MFKLFKLFKLIMVTEFKPCFRVLQKISGSLYVSIPKELVEEFELDRGDPVYIERTEIGCNLHLIPLKQLEAPPKQYEAKDPQIDPRQALIDNCDKAAKMLIGGMTLKDVAAESDSGEEFFLNNLQNSEIWRKTILAMDSGERILFARARNILGSDMDRMVINATRAEAKKNSCSECGIETYSDLHIISGTLVCPSCLKKIKRRFGIDKLND